MADVFKRASQDIVDMLTHGSVGVSSTDTIYGVLGSALSKNTVEKIYKLKERDPNKPLIILIDSLEAVSIFEINLNENLKDFLESVWPGPVSVIIPCESDRFEYLHRGRNSVSFRVPKDRWLRKMIEKTGPLVAPSANRSGMSPAKSIKEAKMYFADEVDFYLDKGINSDSPSTLVEVKRF